jgi:hypothetical protein
MEGYFARRNDSSELLDIVALIGACLCPVGYANCPVKMGSAPALKMCRDLSSGFDDQGRPKILFDRLGFMTSQMNDARLLSKPDSPY